MKKNYNSQSKLEGSYVLLIAKGLKITVNCNCKVTLLLYFRLQLVRVSSLDLVEEAHVGDTGRGQELFVGSHHDPESVKHTMQFTQWINEFCKPTSSTMYLLAVYKQVSACTINVKNVQVSKGRKIKAGTSYYYGATGYFIVS